jgi:hypothetical protein
MSMIMPDAVTTNIRSARRTMLNYSIQDGRGLLIDAAGLLRQYAEEMERYAVRYDDCGNDA